MSQFNFPLEKILNLQLRERDALQNNYSQAVRFFEDIGSELYNLLRKKEEFEQKQSNALEMGVTLQEVRSNQNYLDKLLKQIDQVQVKLQNARAQMEEVKAKLLNKSIELKKYEKLKERFKLQVIEDINRIDQFQMDEISSIRSVKGIR
jgi:flagellar protein FliJ